MHPKLIMSAVVLFLAGCATTAPHGAAGPAITRFKPDTPRALEVRREQLVGWWYGDQPSKEGGRVQWIMRRAADGRFLITFRHTGVAGKIEEQTETGEWGVNANFVITLTRGWINDGALQESPRDDSYFWDVYEVLDTGADRLSYRSIQSGNEYHVRKVPDGFVFPK